MRSQINLFLQQSSLDRLILPMKSFPLKHTQKSGMQAGSDSSLNFKIQIQSMDLKSGDSF